MQWQHVSLSLTTTTHRALELAFIFLLVWYYCTLTIRESILKVNGSRIKGWWRLHHFISTVSAGVLLVWPQGETWQLFRLQFVYFNVYISECWWVLAFGLIFINKHVTLTGIVQYLQFGYQKGLLYRLKALGERHDMDITIEGFHSWMWRGLSFLLPFLYGGYIFQVYNAWTLYKLSSHPEASWQIPVLSLCFFILFIGNTVTTSMTVPQKLKGKSKDRYRLMSLSWALQMRQQIKVRLSLDLIFSVSRALTTFLPSYRVIRLKEPEQTAYLLHTNHPSTVPFLVQCIQNRHSIFQVNPRKINNLLQLI